MSSLGWDTWEGPLESPTVCLGLCKLHIARVAVVAIVAEQQESIDGLRIH